MRTSETAKAAGAVLVAGGAFLGSGLVADLLVRPAPAPPAVLAAASPRMPASPAAPSAAAARAEDSPSPAPRENPAALLASADPDAGKTATARFGCVACHSFGEGGRNGIGPNLYGVVGSRQGSHAAGYAYSAALKAKGGAWDYAELDKWLLKPSAYAPGTKMSYAGVADPKTRADIIAYLRGLSREPLPLTPPG